MQTVVEALVTLFVNGDVDEAGLKRAKEKNIITEQDMEYILGCKNGRKNND